MLVPSLGERKVAEREPWEGPGRILPGTVLIYDCWLHPVSYAAKLCRDRFLLQAGDSRPGLERILKSKHSKGGGKCKYTQQVLSLPAAGLALYAIAKSARYVIYNPQRCRAGICKTIAESLLQLLGALVRPLVLLSEDFYI